MESIGVSFYMDSSNKKYHNDVFVSVAVIAYKHVKYIAQAIDSILDQNVNFTYEIVIGEDGSNDGSAEIILDYQKRYPDIIVPIINSENLGVARNSYNVQCTCKGKYVASLEADDYWCDVHKLQKQVDYLEAHPDIEAVGSNYYYVNNDGSNPVLMIKPKGVNRRYTLNDYMKHGFIIHGNTILRRNNFPLLTEEYKRVRFCIPTMGDVFARALMYDMGDIYVLPDITLCHRDGHADKSSFQAQNESNAMKYTHMMKTLVNEMNVYFGGKYDFTPKLCSRLAIVYIGYLQKALKIDIREWKEVYISLPLKYRLLVIIYIARFITEKVFNKLGIIIKHKI